MGLALTVTVLGVGFFICIVNWIYGRIELKNYSEWKKRSTFNSPTAWLSYAFCIAVIIGVIFIVSLSNVMSGFSNLGKQQDTLNQMQQQEMQNQQQDDSSEE
jgi:predicted PurR-regulated permease PerM